ncbi:MAG: hypothetical protein HC874_27310 [Richelia sp. SL_2_1]|nr:hypothetical protein [Richelia sp. SL_2_1]
MTLDINKTQLTDNTGVTAHVVGAETLDGVDLAAETVYENERWKTDWGYFNRIPKLKAAILMKAIWTVGKGYTTDTTTDNKLRRIKGDGKQTFLDILFSMVVSKQVGRDSFAEIIRDKETGILINLKVLDPGSMRIIFDSQGMIKRYEQMRKDKKGKVSGYTKFQPNEILHFSHNKLAGQIHGISVPESVEEIITADDENFRIMRKLTRFQAVPFVMFKVKSDNTTTINNFKSNIKEAREKGEDLIIPDDENLLTWEVVTVSPSAVLMDWRTSLNNQFYQAVGLPLILFGSAGSTESGGKIEYTAHETVFNHDQLEIEEQLSRQLGIEINLVSPTSLIENLQTDEGKDAQNALTFQPNDVNAARGR